MKWWYRGRLLALAGAGWVAALSGAWAETPLERGTYLVRSIAGCGVCHTTVDADGQEVPGMELAGGLVINTPAFTAHVPNITQDRETGIGGWSDAQIIDALRNGHRPDGSIIRPPMPIEMYRQLTDGDVEAITAYLRTVPPVHHVVEPSVYRAPMPASWGPEVTSVPQVSRSDKLTYGAYLAGPVGHCIVCHTPLEKGPQDFAGKLGIGGRSFEGPWGVSVSANITSHPIDGLGGWTDAQIRTVITTGVRPDGRHLLPPMGTSYYARMTPADLEAVVAYLRSIPARPSP